MKNKKNIIIIILVVIAIILAYFFIVGRKIPITSISLNEHNITMVVGDAKRLEATIFPNDATNKELVWESNNPNVIRVNNGIITSISSGNALVTVKSIDGKVSDNCNVKVLQNEADSIELVEKDLEVRINETKELHLKIVPEDLLDFVSWTSSNENIATVENGIVTGKSSGTTVIKATYGNKEVISNVKVIIPVNSIQMEKESITISVNEEEKLNIIIDPVSSASQELEWKSSNEEIVSVLNGIVKGIKPGTATITASIDGKITTCNVVVSVPVSEVKLNKTSVSIKKGNTISLIPTIIPSNATNNKITWTSSDPKIATVDDSGNVTSISIGSATITATVDGKTATCKVISTDYIITDDSKFKSLQTVAEYNSDTLKYRITRSDGDFVLVWVLDANKQWNSALPNLGTVYPAEELLSKEINNYGYQNKGLVATNASYFWDGWGDYPCTPFIMNKGNIILDIKNINYEKKVYSVLGMTKAGIFKHYHFNENSYSRNTKSREEMISDGVRNSFTFSGTIVNPNGGVSSSSSKNNRTVICQVDENNFVIYSGSKLTIFQIGKALKNTYGCKSAYNLDGGGSRKLYYKTNSMLTPTKVYGGSRAIPDMMYFVEQ